MQHPLTGEEIKTELFSIRFTLTEQERYEECIRRALERNKLARMADINRELLGLRDYGLFTKEDIAFFKGHTLAPALKANVPKPHQKEAHASNSQKRKAGKK